MVGGLGVRISCGVALAVGLVASVGCSGPNHPAFIDLTEPPATAGAAGSSAVTGASGSDGSSSGGDVGADASAGVAGSVTVGTGASGVPEPCSAELPSGFCFVSQKGDFVGGGKSGSISGTIGKIAAFGTGSLGFAAQQTGPGDFQGDFAAALGDYFVPGTYDPAERYPFNLAGAAGLDVFGNGAGCNELTGAFTVREMDRDQYGQFTRFSASFVQHCEGAPPTLAGVFHYNATGVSDPVPADPSDCDVPTPIGLCYASQVGHAGGQGTRVRIDGANTGFSVTESHTGGASVNVRGSTYFWSSFFGGPGGGSKLAPGHYANVVSASPTAPLMDACMDLAGSFDVLAVGYDDPTDGGSGTGTALLRLDVDFAYTCGEAKGELHGKLRYTKP